MLGMLSGKLGHTPNVIILPCDLLDICYDVSEILVIGLHKGSNIDP